MNIKNSRYEITAVSSRQYPKDDLPDIAFVGKSNVGKSSMINLLTGKSKLARTGKTPGKTRELIFFNIDDTLHFVDLPGYGYAKVSKFQREDWGSYIEEYLNNRKNLKLILFLTDIRRTPTEDDMLMYDWIKKSNLKYSIVATKVDKLNKRDLEKNINMLKSKYENEKILLFSSAAKIGRDDIWNEIKTALNVE